MLSMQDMIISELPNIPKPMLLEIINNLGLAELFYQKGDATCPDGSFWNDEELFTLMENYINVNCDSTLEDTLTLETTYVVNLTNIIFDEKENDLSSELTFLVRTDEENPLEYISSILNDLVVKETEYNFVKADLHITKYIPYEGSFDI